MRCFQSELPPSILQNSVESDHGCTLRIYFDNAGDNVMLTLYNVTLTSQKPCKRNKKCDCSKPNGLNYVYFVFSTKILLNFLIIRIIDFNRAEPTCYRRNFPVLANKMEVFST